MRVSWRKWGVSAAAWACVLALGGMALAGAEGDEVEPTASLSPAAAETGLTLESGEATELTFSLEASPEADYDLTVTYGGDGVGLCQTDAETITTDADGLGAFVCAFTTVENPGDSDLNGTVTFSVPFGEEQVLSATALLTVSPAQVEEPEEPEETEGPEVQQNEDVVNHGHCVSYWAHESRAQGLQGSARGAFISSIAQDPEAESAKVAADGEPDETCDYQEELDDALAQQEAASETEASEGPGAANQAAKAAKAKGAKRGGDE